ncbi:MAG: adenosylmethionine--8-amino-7-oxononanoate transaminase [Xanthomonadales bacterium]|nr:Adenosylmethionine-8-amino-7-oxononanoate aminotransferase [Anaerolineae bacterium]MCC6592703.1 adenosylmethionine--8-amino-7-oxononanoate transaminase [Xanthomonadales bacterium]MCE7931914.1 adenosylmethionine--8-amino-7-oxononanoate transaminase [Xanthomonadales bacterium PRO6]
MPCNADLAARDLQVVWHPCTQMSDHEWLPLVPIERGEGCWLIDTDGKRYFDAISSWWVNLFGHAHPTISAAVAAQAARLEHVIFAGFTHEPAIELAERLLALAGPPFARVCYGDSGSSAIEIALKLSFHYWRNAGAGERTRFVVLDGGYHGETLGALSMTQVPLYREVYGPLLLRPLVAPAPADAGVEAAEQAADGLDALLAEHSASVCAVLVEPLVQCAAGMRMHHPQYLRRLRAACDRHGAHFIADEIAVGCGRTGTLFAHQQAGVAPDLLCLAKGLTGGYLPLSAVLTTDPVYRAFYDDYASLRAFLHSHSYTGNALACAAANASLTLLAKPGLMARIESLGAALEDALAPLRAHPRVRDLRRRGLIVAADLVDRDDRPYPWQQRRGLRVYQHGLVAGALLRPLGNTVYCMPPYVAREDELHWLAGVAMAGIEQATRG